MNQPRAHILLCEDDPTIAETLIFSLRQHGYAATHVSLGQQALQELKSKPDLLILDVGLPDISGFDICRQARAHSNVPILFLTAHSSEIDRIVGLELGADDYVTKPFSPREVVARVQAILRRATSAAMTHEEHRLFVVNSAKQRITFCGVPLELSRYEFRLLALLLEHPEHVLSRETIMNTVWEQPEMSFDRTVDAHIKMLRSKLRAIRSDIDPIKTHRGTGYSVINTP